MLLLGFSLLKVLGAICAVAVGMAITLTTTARNASCAAVVALPDVGAGTAKLRIRASTTTLCDINLPNPSFGAPSVGVATAAGLPLSGTASGAGTADNYQIVDRNGAVTNTWSGTAGASGTDLILDNPVLAIGQTVTITAWTHTQPA